MATVKEIEDDDHPSVMRTTTVAAMMETPYPHEYVKTLLEYKLIEHENARQCALEYITNVNRLHTFVHMAFYDMKAFKDMPLPDLLTYIQFIQKNGLHHFKNRRLPSSIL
jgi:hypothetical protein